jgi:FMN reductase
VDDDLLVATPVLLAATAGSPRNALLIDEPMRPLFAYLRGLTLPAAELRARIERAATELAGHARRRRGRSCRTSGAVTATPDRACSAG